MKPETVVMPGSTIISARTPKKPLNIVIRLTNLDPGVRRDDALLTPAGFAQANITIHTVIPAHPRGISFGAKAGIQYSAWMKQPCVYLLTSRRNGTLYTGVTSNLVQRVWQHKNNLVEGFTKKYGVHTLVWFEAHETMPSAIEREKAIKEWRRDWKIELIESVNPQWRDLYEDIV